MKITLYPTALELFTEKWEYADSCKSDIALAFKSLHICEHMCQILCSSFRGQADDVDSDQYIPSPPSSQADLCRRPAPPQSSTRRLLD